MQYGSIIQGSNDGSHMQGSNDGSCIDDSHDDDKSRAVIINHIYRADMMIIYVRYAIWANYSGQ